MTRQVTIAALQLPSWAEGESPRERKAFRLAQVERWLLEAGERGADVACLGETATTAWVDAPTTDEEIFEDAYRGPTIDLVRGIAREHAMNVVLPIAAHCDGRVQNLAVFVDREGDIVGHYAKVHPTRGEMARGFVAGDDFPVFDLDFGRVGAVICHDLSFPESTRVLGLKGAEVVFWPNLWSGWGEDLCNAVIRSRAIDNGFYLVSVNYGQPEGRAWRPGQLIGASGVTSPDGLTLSSAGRYVGMSLVTVDLDRPRIAHSWTWSDEAEFRLDMLADRRPDTYRLIADETIVPPARRGPDMGR